jgi:predicted dithiol-disulfide oxidoreductase (DUF899 family)
MSDKQSKAKLSEYRGQIADIRRRMRELSASIQAEPVADYELSDTGGTVRLSALMGDKNDLIAVHSMGIACAYCTLWADGYNGIYDHLVSRAAFVIVGPDAPHAQQEFARARGWRFRLASHQGTTFAEDMGYRSAKGAWLPGLSVFRRDGARLFRVSDAASSPGDDFCALWHIFDLLPGGPGGWTPRSAYP